VNILIRELKSNYRGLLIWGLALMLLNIWMVSMFPSFAADGAGLAEMVDMFPPGMIKVFGLDIMAMDDPLGFYGAEAYFMVVLFGSIYAAILGSGILAKEQDDKTIEFLLAKPVSRLHIIGEKALAWIIYLVLFNLGIGLATWLSFELFDVGEFSRTTLFWMLTAPLLVHLVFASLGFFSALFFTRRKSALSVSIGLVLGLYFINTIALLSENVEFLRWLTPFHYADAADIFSDGALHPGYALLLLGFALLLCIVTGAIYRRKNITL